MMAPSYAGGQYLAQEQFNRHGDASDVTLTHCNALGGGY